MNLLLRIYWKFMLFFLKMCADTERHRGHSQRKEGKGYERGFCSSSALATAHGFLFFFLSVLMQCVRDKKPRPKKHRVNSIRWMNFNASRNAQMWPTIRVLPVVCTARYEFETIKCNLAEITNFGECRIKKKRCISSTPRKVHSNVLRSKWIKRKGDKRNNRNRSYRTTRNLRNEQMKMPVTNRMKFHEWFQRLNGMRNAFALLCAIRKWKQFVDNHFIYYYAEFLNSISAAAFFLRFVLSIEIFVCPLFGDRFDFLLLLNDVFHLRHVQIGSEKIAENGIQWMIMNC